MKIVFALCLFLLAGVHTAQADDLSFDDWRRDFEARAIARGFAPQLVEDTFKGLSVNPGVIERDRSQPEFTRTMADYIKGVLSEARINQGRVALEENAALFDAVAAKYGVPTPVLSAVWGLESAYGKIQGSFDVVRALSTLAHDGRRRAWAEGELFAVLDILTNGYARREQLKGAWAGAMGQTQFLPTAYLNYAVDWDGDGRKDIWGSTADALASTANYLSEKGWRRGEPWGVEVQLPQDFAYELADDTVLSIGSWSVRNVVRADHAIWSMTEQGRPARLLLPAGYKGPAFLTSSNFGVFKRYNNSTAYALGVGLLANVLGDTGATAKLITPWPPSTGTLSRSQIKRLQQNLGLAGFDAGVPDGISGPNTRRALRAFQKAYDLIPDGYLDRAAFDAIEVRLADLANAPVTQNQSGDKPH